MKISLWFVWIVLLGSCSPKVPTWEETPCRGRIESERYYDPEKLFSLQGPPLEGMIRIEETSSSGGSSTVTFRNEAGEFFRVEVFKGLFNPSLKDPEGKKAAKVFHKWVLRAYDDIYCRAEVLEGEILLKKGRSPAYFAVTLIPKNRFKRGFIVFFERNLLIVLSYQGSSDDDTNLKEKLIELNNIFIPYCWH